MILNLSIITFNGSEKHIRVVLLILDFFFHSLLNYCSISVALIISTYSTYWQALFQKHPVADEGVFNQTM